MGASFTKLAQWALTCLVSGNVWSFVILFFTLTQWESWLIQWVYINQKRYWYVNLLQLVFLSLLQTMFGTN